jgi:hypothetical protein
MSDYRDQWETIRCNVAAPGEHLRVMKLIRHRQTGAYRLADPLGALVGISRRDAEALAAEGGDNE